MTTMHLSFLFLVYLSTCLAQSVSPGTQSTNVPWKSGHASVFQAPYVVVYGGTTDTAGNTTSAIGSNTVWVWHSQNKTWYNAQALSNYATNDQQVFVQAIPLPSSGQTLILASNTSSNGSLLQKLDTNVWAWTNPTSNNPPATSSGYSMSVVSNRIYTYGGVSVDGNGNRMNSAVQNSLYFLDANSYSWSSGSNGPAITDHSTCYLASCNCLVTFGGTETGNPADAQRNIYIYDINSSTWNLQISPSSVNGAIPGPRRLHTATCLNNQMIVYGGGTTTPSDPDVWVLDASAYPNLTWHQQPVANPDQGPRVRMGHSAVLDSTDKKIYIFGGWGSSATSDNNMYILDYSSWSWSFVTPAGAPSGQPGPTSPNSPSDSSSANVGAIAGGVVGGVAVLAILVTLGILFYRRRRRQQKTAQQVHNEKKMMDQDDDDQDDYYWRYGAQMMDDDSSGARANPNRVSKAWTSGTQDSLYRRSDYALGMTASSSHGDVPNAVLEEMVTASASEDGTLPYSLTGSRQSRQASKIFLTNELASAGQVPNEIITQKPNEFSVPASQFAAHMNNSIRIHHYHSDHEGSVSSRQQDSAHLSDASSQNHNPASQPLSGSLEVLRSIKTNTTATTTHNVPISHTYHQGPASFSRAFSTNSNTLRGREDDSMSVLPEHTAPIQYIPGASKQFSVATTATNNSAPSQLQSSSTGTPSAIPLTHHQYPSSSVPVARPVSSSPTTSTSTPANPYLLHHQHPPLLSGVLSTSDTDTKTPEAAASSSSSPPPQPIAHPARDPTMVLYDSVSPLDRLATLGNTSLLSSQAQQATHHATSPTTAANDDDKEITPPNTSGQPPATPHPAQLTTSTPSTSSSRSSLPPVNVPQDTSGSTQAPSSDQPSTSNLDDKQARALAIGNMLPRRYHLDRHLAPMIGPTNSILYITNTAQQDTPAVIKTFGRREAWERECRTLVKLKSPFVVDLLEVLTIQDESLATTTSTNASSATIDTDHPNDLLRHDDNDDDRVKYLTVMERLDETLATFIRRTRPSSSNDLAASRASEAHIKTVAKDIVCCLQWVHEKGIAFCDLKPSNLMHKENGQWKLIDFEASRTIGEECVGVITPRYCPPEVARATTYGLEGANGVVATASVDWWALGCVIYELETKRPLFSNTIKDETILHFVSHPSSSTPILNNGLRWNDHKELEIPQLDRQVKDPQARQLIRQLLSRNPAERGTAAQLLDHPYFKS
ncbi:hypothetical protein DM01DRAFT_1380369 [Hesseltinella vesiculosa]|uniref:Protein kinase domain-containing protein n=1 Tax=Hesseltinella vesiculosa TaxID=101127 RepID=A0A1X2GU21_9FUNG|nr:hypothetical protein DM01DRAFT_1380369 [Hesseltinella vesiculosa]